MAEPKEKELPAPPLADLMTRLGKGRLLADGGEALTEIVSAVKELGGKGELTIKIRVKRVPNTESVLVFEYEVNGKAPKSRPSSTCLYAGDDGSLTPNDPNQRELAFATNPARSA